MVRDMTAGNPWRHIVLFAVPLVIGNFFVTRKLKRNGIPEAKI